MQNPPSVPNHIGNSSPQANMPGSLSYSPLPPTQPVVQSNSAATTAMVWGILTAIGTLFLAIEIANILNEIRTPSEGIGYVYDHDLLMFMAAFLGAGLCAVFALAYGYVGQIKGKANGGQGLVSSSFGMFFGLFYFFIIPTTLLLGIWLAHYR